MAKKSFANIKVRNMRQIVGIPAHRPGAFQICIKGALTGKTYSKPPTGSGGMNNIAVRQAFYDAAKSCGADIKKPRPGGA